VIAKIFPVVAVVALVFIGCTNDDDGSGLCGAIGAKVWGGSSCNTAARTPAVLIFGLARDGSSIKRVSVCSGALITQRDVLTAGHCIKNLKEEVSQKGLGFAGWEVYIGGQDGEKILAQRGDAHPNYSGRAADPNDVGVITLNGEPQPAVAPLSILLSEELKEGTELTAYGFGTGENDRGDIGVLKAIGFKISTFLRNNLLVEGDGKSSICGGDSGGPAVADNKSGAPAIVAVTAFGDARGCETAAARLYGFVNLQLQSNADFIIGRAPGVRVD
jgi:secreted trypsin-like serine protease